MATRPEIVRGLFVGKFTLPTRPIEAIAYTIAHPPAVKIQKILSKTESVISGLSVKCPVSDIARPISITIDARAHKAAPRKRKIFIVIKLLES